jgi:hypothetical protein
VQPRRSLARVEPLLALVAGIEQQVPRLTERPLQTTDEGERVGREYVLGSVDPWPADFDALDGG